MLLCIEQGQGLVPAYDLSLSCHLFLKFADLDFQISVPPLEHVGLGLLLSDQLPRLFQIIPEVVALVHKVSDDHVEDSDLACHGLDRGFLKGIFVSLHGERPCTVAPRGRGSPSYGSVATAQLRP